ncbi:MAG: diguanylate cyclase [Butyrivibrio sp.]|nr:diguanylate cyclase [Butyrivibrio sp.]
MNKIEDELSVYKTVAAMIGSILYRYEPKTDTMQFFFGRTDLSRYGSVVNDYVQRLQRQRAVNPEIDADNFIRALKDGAGYFECSSRMNDFMGTVKSYTVIGKALYDDNNEPSYIVGKMIELEEPDRADIKRGKDDIYTDKLTGMYNKNGIKSRLEALCVEKNGGEGALLDITINNLKTVASENSSLSADSIMINVAQCLKNMFPYDAYIGRMRQDEFNVIYYGGEINDRFIMRLTELGDRIETLLGTDESLRLEISGGMYYGPFIQGEAYDIREKAYMALFSSKYQGKKDVVVYSKQLEEAYVNDNWDAVNKAFDDVQFDHNLIETALQIMSSSGNISDAVNLIFGKVGRKYKIDRITVWELNSEDKTLNSSYEWAGSSYIGWIIDRHKPDDYNIFEKIYSNEDIIIVPDTSKWQSEEETKLALMSVGVKSFVRCIFSGNHRISGCIAFECYENKRTWSDSEIKTLKLITKFVSSYLLTVREYEGMLSEKESRETHDTLTGYYKYNTFLKEAAKYVRLDKSGKVAIMYTGLKQLTDINARYGYDVGDEVLKGFAELISGYKDRFIMGCRVNADNFVILANVFDSRGNRISAALANIFSNAFYDKYGDLCPGIDISPDMGISIINDRTKPIEDYVEKALEARGRARNMGIEGILAD